MRIQRTFSLTISGSYNTDGDTSDAHSEERYKATHDTSKGCLGIYITISVMNACVCLFIYRYNTIR